MVQLITAWNPRGRPLALGDNWTRQEEFERWLDDVGHQWAPAAGVAEDGTWAEAGVAVAGLARPDAVAIGRRYEQEAIYEWDPAGHRISIVSCVDDRVWIRHARAQPLTSRPCPLRPPGDPGSAPCAGPDDEFRRMMLWALGCDACPNDGFRSRA